MFMVVALSFLLLLGRSHPGLGSEEEAATTTEVNYYGTHDEVCVALGTTLWASCKAALAHKVEP